MRSHEHFLVCVCFLLTKLVVMNAFLYIIFFKEV